MINLSEGRIGARFNEGQGRKPRPEDMANSLHCHPHFELLYLIKGRRRFFFNNTEYEAGAGDLIVFRPSDAHVEYAGTTHVSYFVLRFRPEELTEAKIEIPQVLLQLGPVIPLPDQNRFVDLFQRMMEERGGDDDNRVLQRLYLAEFLIWLQRALQKTITVKDATSRVRIKDAIPLLQQNLNDELNLNQIAKRIFMSPSRFSHVFKEQTGTSPKKFQIAQRIARASELLTSTTLSTREIASQLGYDAPYYFYRQFRQKTGLTPSEYRRRHSRPRI